MKEFQANKAYQKSLDEAPDDAAKKAVHDKALERARIGAMSESEYSKRKTKIYSSGGLFKGDEVDALDKEREKRSSWGIIPSDIKKEIAAENNPPPAIDPRAAHEAILNSGDGNPAGTPDIRPNLRPALSSQGKSPRNLRNNNPGNITAGAWANEHGATGSDGRFAIFPDKETGSRAMDALLQRYTKKDGLDTVSGIVGKWAPSSENDTGAYSNSVAKRMGVSPDQKLDMNDPAVSAAIAKEMSRIEGSADAYRDKQLPDAARPAIAKEMSRIEVGADAYRDKQLPDAARPAIAGNQVAKVG